DETGKWTIMPDKMEAEGDRGSSSSSRISPSGQQAASTSLSDEFKAITSATTAKIVGGKPKNFAISGGYIIKHVSEKEFHFYSENRANLDKLPGFAPKVYAMENSPKGHFMKMEDLKNGMSKPFEIDIKLGKSFENAFYLENIKGIKPEEVEQKVKDRAKKNDRTGASLNSFSVASYTGRLELTVKKDKHLSAEQAKDLLSARLHSPLTQDVFAQSIAELINDYPKIFDENKSVTGASLLLVLDEAEPEKIKLRMIDFGNYWKPETSNPAKERQAISQSNSENMAGLTALQKLFGSGAPS
ncbi:inositol polyphosphate kinase family protein, partial [uncultured Tateyamaria sp.]|uniref:inositol polyphosphate kinase family protein n=1 Tax=uncultured Tateyamaria sp. TaxID=455651 RepID=UPI002610F662